MKLSLSLFFFFFATPCCFQDFSSLTRDWTWIIAVKALSPNYWTVMELLQNSFLTHIIVVYIYLISVSQNLLKVQGLCHINLNRCWALHKWVQLNKCNVLNSWLWKTYVSIYYICLIIFSSRYFLFKAMSLNMPLIMKV